ncbi:MAG: TIGR02594 family protein [Gemmatimonadales bacterium]
MDVAYAEKAKGIKEQAANDGLVAKLRETLVQERTEQARMQSFAELQSKSLLLGGGGSGVPSRYRLFDQKLPDAPMKALGDMEAPNLAERNPEIAKYFQGVTSHPSDDKKGRVWELQPTYGGVGRAEVTAWCAAFVNWCLTQAGAPHHGLGTARAWLDFGTPIMHPIYGCITVVKPSQSTGSTTGHVGFFVRKDGGLVRLLGGNQGDSVCEANFGESTVLGYRWPTGFNHYLMAAKAGVLT